MIRNLLLLVMGGGIFLSPVLFWIGVFTYIIFFEGTELLFIALVVDLLYVPAGLPVTTLCTALLILGTKPLRKEFLTYYS
ncbi:hypothetical protein EBR66_03100 [bacterium]|nr:hypothetical protein [bacterium]